MSQDRKLVKKLAQVMKQVKNIEKRGYNKFHKYHYATESDVAEKIRDILADQHVMMIPNMSSHSIREHVNNSGKTEYIATVIIDFTFYDGETGEEITFSGIGEGQDSGDKAVYKAMTGAQKYALMKAFLIPTNDDPERDSGSDVKSKPSNTSSAPKKNSESASTGNGASDKQKTLIRELAEKKKGNMNTAEAWTNLQQSINVFKSLDQFTKTEASKAIEHLQQK